MVSQCYIPVIGRNFTFRICIARNLKFGLIYICMWGMITHWPNIIRAYQNVASSQCVRFASTSYHNLEPTETGKYVLKLNESWNFQILLLCVLFAWRAWMKGGKERWWSRGRSLYRCGHVENEEYWDVCNGTLIQGRFKWSSPQKEMLHFNCPVRNERGVCCVPPHI